MSPAHSQKAFSCSNSFVSVSSFHTYQIRSALFSYLPNLRSISVTLTRENGMIYLTHKSAKVFVSGSHDSLVCGDCACAVLLHVLSTFERCSLLRSFSKNSQDLGSTFCISTCTKTHSNLRNQGQRLQHGETTKFSWNCRLKLTSLWARRRLPLFWCGFTVNSKEELHYFKIYAIKFAESEFFGISSRQ